MKSKEPTSRNERYFQSTGKYKSEKDRNFNDGKGKYGKEWTPKKFNNRLTGW